MIAEAILAELGSHDAWAINEVGKSAFTKPSDWFAARVKMRMGEEPVRIVEPQNQTITPFDPTATQHFFLEYMGRFYDAECPEGVDNWGDLPFYQRRGFVPRHHVLQNGKYLPQ